MPHVTIIGAGIAGLAAGLRLLERGFDITLLEQDDFLGGKLGAHQHGPDDAYHEHSYHMYLNWYHNFWAIADEAGVRGNFFAQPMTGYLRRTKDGQQTKLIKAVNVGSAETTLQNMFSGLRAPPDMFIYSYSLLDLLATPVWRHDHLDQKSVLAYMSSRPYITDEAMSVQGDMLAKAFACPSFLTASNSFRRFIAYGFQCPTPMMWLLRGNTQEALMGPLEAHMRRVARRGGRTLEILKLHQVARLVLDEAGTIVALDCHELASSPTIDGPPPKVKREFQRPVQGNVILAAPPQAVARLLDDAVYEHAPKLGDVRKLRSEPMISMDLYFNRKLPNLPTAIVNLQDSEFDMSFLDTAQTWVKDKESGNTVLNVVASDAEPIARLTAATIKKLLIEELNKYVPFDHHDIEHGRTHLQRNLREALFTNEVGTADLRPTTRTGIPNLFMAGDYTRNPIDVVTIEGAVVSGLYAAEAVRKRVKIGQPIEALLPRALSETSLMPFKLAGAPAAYAAKTVAVSQRWLRDSVREVFPRS